MTEAEYQALPNAMQGAIARLAQAKARGIPMTSPYMIKRHPLPEELATVQVSDLPRNLRRSLRS